MTQQPWGPPPPQQYQPTPPGAYQAMGYPPQQVPPAPPIQTPDAAHIFDRAIEGGEIAPSFEWGPVGSRIEGEVTSTYPTVVTERVRKGEQAKPKFYPPRFPGEAPRPIPQLNVTLQTSLRNWQGVKPEGIPTAKNPDGTDGAPLPPSEDTGKRRIYVKYDLLRAVGVALREAGVGTGVGLQVGSQLAVIKVGEKDTGMDNPLPLYQAQVRPPSASAQLFQQAPAPSAYDQGGQFPPQQQVANQGPQQQVAPPPQQPWGPPVAPQPITPSAPAATSPWTPQPPPPPAPGSPWANTTDPPF